MNIHSLFVLSFAILIRDTLQLPYIKLSSSRRLSPAYDPNSYARPEIAKVSHVHMALDVEFDRKILTGSVTLSVEKVDENATQVILDAKGMNILSAVDDSGGGNLDFFLHPEEQFGSKLEVNLPNSSEKLVKIKINYETTQNCTALQWLSPSQTAGKTHPYMFSQCQAIHCRSMLPCQDTPSVKMPYSAEITAPKDITMLMSALGKGEPDIIAGGKKLYRFEQKVPIPSYLIAIAGGKLESRKVGPRSHVWSELEYVDKAAYEFAETETMLQKAEELNGPYVWGIYDILVLPPSFPYGGMENPCLTFATPTLLAGDRSLTNVIAHEIAHSWTGNLVTNKNSEHFWLNEGFTVYTERKILGRMYGEQLRHFSAIDGWRKLKYAIDILGNDNPLTNLVVDLDGVSPDEAFSRVPYEKGSTFLWYLEEIVGSDMMELFMKSYYDEFKYQSIDSYQFKDYFMDYFKDKDLSDIEWDKWFNQPGMPIYKPKFNDSLAMVCTNLKQRWMEWNESTTCPFKSEDLNSFSSGQKIEFIGQLLEEEPLSVGKLEKMQEVYDLNAVNNSEIKFRWIRLGLRGKWKDAVPRAIEMVSEVGRMKFLKPLYRDLYNSEETRQVALDTFKKNKSSYMNVAVERVKNILEIVEKNYINE